MLLTPTQATGKCEDLAPGRKALEQFQMNPLLKHFERKIKWSISYSFVLQSLFFLAKMVLNSL